MKRVHMFDFEWTGAEARATVLLCEHDKPDDNWIVCEKEGVSGRVRQTDAESSSHCCVACSVHVVDDCDQRTMLQCRETPWEPCGPPLPGEPFRGALTEAYVDNVGCCVRTYVLDFAQVLGFPSMVLVWVHSPEDTCTG